MPSRHNAWKLFVAHCPARHDAAGDAGGADQRNAGVDMSSEVVDEHVIGKFIAWFVGTRVGVDVDQARDQPSSIMNQLSTGHRLERDAITIKEQNPLVSVRQAAAAKAQCHQRTPSS
jgi:hypothetical protein